MYRNVVTEMSPHRNGQTEKLRTPVQHCKVATKRSCKIVCEKQHLKLKLSTNIGFEDWYPINFVLFSKIVRQRVFELNLGKILYCVI